MRVECTLCGDPFDAKRATARYCSERCKKRAQRAGLVVPPSGSSVAGSVDTVRPDVSPDGAVHAAVLAELEVLEKVDTVLGQTALILARQMESGRDTGSSAAAVSRELDRLMVRIRGAEGAPRDQLAAVRRRRDEKRGRARRAAAGEPE